ncbi:unnamed protein product [Rotaria sordida]|uniref:C2H2-type domain-containing protein n=1 Tax=Rotaria sordida TaxID=392033 RepID=A0A814AUB8_9BILA|nr:unnamed protein product [Rotaria sordida]CAF1016235.1 unnamed protein product [Rotaria sordida]
MQNHYYTTTGTPQRPPLGSDMNYLYLSPSQQQVNRQGIFLKRSEKIDWRRIAAVDVDRIARDMDFQALQDNLENITLCNIDAEVDSRAMDPNFVKLYKMAQLTIEYLLVCQDEITTQLTDYEQLKSKGFHDHEDARQQIEKLKNELNETKKELKKRRKMLETQQRMLMAQNSNYHTCPVCTHAFLSIAYLQAHIKRRHPDYDPSKRREHDIDVEKEIQCLKDELNKKDTELQMIKVQKAVDEEKIRDRDTNIRQLKEEIQTLTTKMTILDDRLSQMRTNPYTQSSSPHRNETGFSELLKENNNLRADIEQFKQSLQQAENNLKQEVKFKRRYERENENLIKEITNLKENLQLLQKAPGDTGRLTKELINFQNRYNEEKLRREKLEEELQKANDQLGQFPNQRPSTQIERPGEPPFPTRPSRPIPTTDIYLPEYCPSLVERLKDNPKVLTKYRDEARRQFVEELEDYENLGISDTDTRLTDLDFRTKMESVLQTRRNIQNDLPNFERIRANLTRILDKNINERSDVRRSITSIRSTGSKLVTFEDEHQRSKYDNIKKNLTDQRGAVTTTIQSKPKYDHSRPTIKNESDDDITISNANESDDDTQPTRPGITSDIQPPPRKHVPPSKTQNGISSLVAVSMRPTTTTNQTTTISARPRQQIVKPISTTTNKSNSDSESENAVPSPSTAGPYSMNVTEKKRLIEQKLHEASKKGEKPTINAIAQGFRPSRESLATQHDDDDNDQSESFTTLHTNPAQKPLNGHLPQLSGRESVNNNLLSSGDISQHTYDSLWKSQAGKGAELRRPLTADSAKTSILDSDDNQDEGESN